jgi:uncharacterized protein (TIGR00661 family)
MKILYGVQATGQGHISRSREVINRLKARGHEVRVLLSGRDPALLWEMESFEPYDILRGFTFYHHRGKLLYAKTARRLRLFRFYHDIRTYDAAGYNFVISDFEPLSARIARRHRLPSIGLGHQYAFCYNIPVAGDHWLARTILRNYAPVQYPVGLHWHHFDQPILPPIVPDTISRGSQRIDEKILVYLPFEEPDDIEALLKPIRSHQFFIYWRIRQPRDDGQLHWRPYSRNGFLQDLAECNGVISNAGFELASEAMNIGKKLLVKPLAGQMEQASNALAIRILEIGWVMEELDGSIVRQFLESPPIVAPMAYPDVAAIFVDWLEKGHWEHLDETSKKAWSRVGAADRA